MKYILEHSDEFNRLERQCEQSHYQLSDEVSHLDFKPGKKVLDAGCGSGALSRHLANTYPGLDITACDRSDLRLMQAKNFSNEQGLGHIQFFPTPLECLPFEDNHFDIVICRYVYEYLVKPLEVTQELKRVLKPGGKLCLIDLDGVFLNLYSVDTTLQSNLEVLRRELKIDLFVGRKLSSFMVESGLMDIDRRLSACEFMGTQLGEEYENNRERLRFARPELIRIFGNESSCDEFIDLYLREHLRPTSTLFHNKFVVTGTK